MAILVSDGWSKQKLNEKVHIQLLALQISLMTSIINKTKTFSILILLVNVLGTVTGVSLK